MADRSTVGGSRHAAEEEARGALEAIEQGVRDRLHAHRLEWHLSAALHRHGARDAEEARRHRPSAFELERHLEAWRAHVPEGAAARAALARLLAARHARHLHAATGVTAALGADRDEVRSAHEALYGEPLASPSPHGAAAALSRARVSLAAAGRRWDTLPPTRLVALLAIGICLPQAILGLPIAAAVVGPLPALAVLAVLGAALTVAMGAETEAIVRSAPFRAGAAFLGRLSDEFLGTRASTVATVVAAARTALSVLAAYIGLSLTLAALMGVSRPVWATLTFVALAALLLRGGLRITVDAGAAVGLASCVLVLVMAALAIPHVSAGDLTRTDVPLLGGDASLADAVGPLIGMTLMCFIGNVYVIQVARRVLPRDEGGGSVVRGTLIGTAALTLIAALWLLPVTGAIPAEVLTGERGTAIAPLADLAGTGVTILGTAATVLLLGLGIERASLALFKFVDERLPHGGEGLGRTAVCALPALGVCAVGELLISAGDTSFTDVMSLSGVVSNIVVSGAVPMLLVLAARRRGELRPARTIGRLGGPGAVALLTAGYAALLVAFATVLYDTAPQRAGAAAAALVLIAVVLLSARDGAFRPAPTQP